MTEAATSSRRRKWSWVEICGIAEQQHGVITLAQTEAAGMTERVLERMLRTRTFVPLLPGIFRIAGTPKDFKQALHAAVLQAGPGCAVSGAAAAELHGFLHLGRECVEVSSPRRFPGVKGFRFRRVELKPDEIAMVEGLPVTTEVRTLVDLAPTANEKKLRQVVDALMRAKRLPCDKLEPLGQVEGPGMAKLRNAIDVAFMATVLRTIHGWGLPLPDVVTTEYEDGTRVVRQLGKPAQRTRQLAVLEGGRRR